MSKALEKRLAKIEAKLNPKPKGTFDLVKFITHDVRLECDRLMKLSQSDFEQELTKPPHSEANQVARTEASYQRAFDAMTPEEQQKNLGYAGFDPQEYARIMKERNRVLTSPDNWITRLFAERARKLNEEQSMNGSH